MLNSLIINIRNQAKRYIDAKEGGSSNFKMPAERYPTAEHFNSLKEVSSTRRNDIAAILCLCSEAMDDNATPKMLAKKVFKYCINLKTGLWGRSDLREKMLSAISCYEPTFLYNPAGGSKDAFNLLAPESSTNQAAATLASLTLVHQLSTSLRHAEVRAGDLEAQLASTQKRQQRSVLRRREHDRRQTQTLSGVRQEAFLGKRTGKLAARIADGSPLSSTHGTPMASPVVTRDG